MVRRVIATLAPTTWPLWAAVLLLLSVGVALLCAEQLLGAPRQDIEQLGLLLLGSGAGSLLVGVAGVRWATRRLGSLRVQLALATALGLLVALINVLVSSLLMFLDTHDRGLLLVLLGFAAAVTLVFGYIMAGALAARVEALAATASRLAGGDLGARAGVAGRDEVARLGAALDDMAVRLEAAFARERAAEASRRALIAAVSHDLRTPLTTTRAMIEAITDGVVTERTEVQRYLQLMHREVQHLSRLIDDLFELSQIESGRLQLDLAPLDLPALLRETLAAYEAQAGELGVRLELAAEAAPRVTADGARLERVLRNLLDNALAHTPSGGLVSVAAETTAESACVTIADSGPGVPPDERARVFEQFWRGERSRHRGEGPHASSVGAGLGLAIARGLVQAHGGEISVGESRHGGAAFRFTIPSARPTSLVAAGQES